MALHAPWSGRPRPNLRQNRPVPPLLPVPKSREEIRRIQSERKRAAVERALRSPFWQEAPSQDLIWKSSDDPEVWRSIPILDKDTLRALSDAQFYGEFCHLAATTASPSTGARAASPASRSSTRAASATSRSGWSRSRAPSTAPAPAAASARTSPSRWASTRSGRSTRAAPPRAASPSTGPAPGTSTPSALQLELIQRLKPTIWLGMSSYALHLANLAEARGLELLRSRSVMTSAEPVSQAKRDKIERTLGREAHRQLRHDRGRHDGRGGRARRGLPHLDRPLLHRGARPEVARAGEGRRGRHAGRHRAADQQRHAVPALELGRPRHLQRGRRRRGQAAVLGLSAHQARAPHRRLLQDPRRQPRPPGPRGLHVPPPRDRRLPRRGAERGRQRHPEAFDRGAPRHRPGDVS